MPEHPTDAHFSFTFVFKQALIPANLNYTERHPQKDTLT